jgi:hypothetical protein
MMKVEKEIRWMERMEMVVNDGELKDGIIKRYAY